MPVWCISPVSDEGVLVIDWKPEPQDVSTFENLSPSLRGCTGTAVDNCGNPVFHVVHSGLINDQPNNLFIYDLDGMPLLNNNLVNGPGMNAKAFAGEIQVVKVAGTINEWYIIYSMWKTNNGAPLGDGYYTPAQAVYSRVRYSCDSIYVLERDVEIKVNGTAYTYTTGCAVSVLPSDPMQLCLYLVRRSESVQYLSVDRFLINNSGINFMTNTGNISTEYWYLTIANSSIEVSNDGKRIAINNRHQDGDWDDIFLIDAVKFNNSPDAVQGISIRDLILQPDFNIVNFPAPIDYIAANNPNLPFLKNIDRKIGEIEFSPGGDFLYFVNGGFGAGGMTNMTYMAQIFIGPFDNPAPYPFDIRLQIQKPPGSIDWNEGTGGTEVNYPDTYYPTILLENVFDNKMYLIKRDSPYLFIIPYPDEPMDQMLSPGDVDFSDGDHPNILLHGKIWMTPDQIDGYDYITSVNPVFNLGSDTMLCPPGQIPLTPGDQFASYCWQDGSTDEVFFATDTGVFWVSVLDEFGCSYADTIKITTTDEGISLGPDFSICPGDSAVISPGAGYQQYTWQDGSTNKDFTVKYAGSYWVEVTVGAGCNAADSVIISLLPFNEIEFGQDTIFSEENTLILDAGPGYDNYNWQNGSNNRYFQVTEDGYYWVNASTGQCTTSDSVYVDLKDCIASLLIPNCFTPNGDGYNERFVVSSQNLKNFTMLIFNRWGQELYETSDVNAGWDGRVNGNVCPIGTYFYLIRFTTECPEGLEESGERKGSVTLLE